MKTKMFALLSACLIAVSAFCTVDPTSDTTKSAKEDTTDATEAIFNVSFSQENGTIVVRVRGEFDEFSSVSITNNRGSEYQFSFIQNGSNEIVFNVNDLKPGSYYVVLNTNQEIRMKRFLKK